MNFEEKRCPHCGALLVENASFCPYCESVLIEKRPAEMPKPKRRRRITAAILLTAVLLVTLTAVGFANRGKIIDAQGAELTYETDGQTFHLALSFESQGGAPFFGQPLFTVEVREDQVRGQVSSSRVFVDNGGGVDKKNEFLALVDNYEVTTTPCDGITLLQIDETCIPTTSNAAIEAIPSYHTEQLKEGEGNVIWTIYLKNGDTLRLRHTVKITRVPVVTLTENDYPMATVDDLNVLLDTLAHEADRKSVYILQLPAVTYEGGLTMKNFCCDLVGSEGGTTFTGTVTRRAAFTPQTSRTSALWATARASAFPRAKEHSCTTARLKTGRSALTAASAAGSTPRAARSAATAWGCGSTTAAARRARAATMATACTKTTAPPCASPRCRAQRRWISITACSEATG